MSDDAGEELPTRTPIREDIALHGALTANLVGFCRLLRRQGTGVGAAEESDTLRALGQIDLARSDTFYHCLRTALAKSRREQRIFDDCFHSYWGVWDRALELDGAPPPSEQAPSAAPDEVKPSPGGTVAALSVKDWLAKGHKTEGEEDVAGYSPMQVESRRDFADFGSDELEEIEELISSIARALAKRLSRRLRPAGRRGRLDFRRTLRHNLRRGGDIADLAFLRKRQQRLKLVLLCDVSRSMDLYSRFLIQFIYALHNRYRHIETFAFSTSLQRISDALKNSSLPGALAELALGVPGWSGGTRIGASLHAFVDRYADALLDRHTVVLLLSDGWDTGDVELLESSLFDIRRRARALVWLNPLMGNPDFRPETAALKAALPHIDLMAPAHNIAALRDLVNKLASLRPSRRGSLSPVRPTAQEQSLAETTPSQDGNAAEKRPTSGDNLRALARQRKESGR
jgi:uncharacterized protein with von Willebrand factor type A (vWA) domain